MITLNIKIKFAPVIQLKEIIPSKDKVGGLNPSRSTKNAGVPVHAYTMYTRSGKLQT